jgi:hypothetical protein
MKRCLLTALVAALTLPLGAGGPQAPAVSVPAAGIAGSPGDLTSAQAQADFDLMRKALEEAHPGLYRYSTKAEMDSTFDVQRAKLNGSIRKPEFMTVVAETLAAIHCGHTSWQPDEETQKAWRSALLFPLRVLAEGKHLMVLFNDTPDDRAIRPGMEVLEINGHNAADLLDRICRTESADGDIQTGKTMHISGRFGLYYWWLVEQTETFTVKARDASGQTVTARLSGVSDADRKKNQNPVNNAIQANIDKLNWSHENQSLRFVKDPDIAQIRLRYFIGENYPMWVEETFKTLRDKGTKALIIDLRGNGGGEDMYGAMLVSYLTDKPFRYFDHINVKTIAPSAFFKEHSDWGSDFEAKLREGTTPDPASGYRVTATLHPGVAEQPPGKCPFLGKVFVLIDGGTFSTAADFCAVTHHLKRATFVGEETGGGYYGNNSGPDPRVTLPNSKLRVRLPMYEYWNAVPGYDGTRRGTRPDHVVQTKTANLLRGVDEQLDLAVRLADADAPPK